MTPHRAWVLLPSGNRLNLLAPDPTAWTDRDLAIGLSRTYRWSGYSAWDHPLSVAQHSLTVLELRQQASKRRLTEAEARRELLHDATEALLGGYDPITPLKPHLGEGYERLVALHQQAVDTRYSLPAWDETSYRAHKAADHLAAASEALNVVGWSRHAIRHDLKMTLAPVTVDPLPGAAGYAPWEPWPAGYAAERFLDTLLFLTSNAAEMSHPARNAELA
ncbi:MAG: HD family hydrolase [Rhodospirillales bacterium]|nr:HD family hydrolase [Rhodospirillales bacterium]